MPKVTIAMIALQRCSSTRAEASNDPREECAAYILVGTVVPSSEDEAVGCVWKEIFTRAPKDRRTTIGALALPPDSGGP